MAALGPLSRPIEHDEIDDQRWANLTIAAGAMGHRHVLACEAVKEPFVEVLLQGAIPNFEQLPVSGLLFISDEGEQLGQKQRAERTLGRLLPRLAGRSSSTM